MIDFPFDRDEAQLYELIDHAKKVFDRVYLKDLSPEAKHKLLPYWYIWQERTIKPLVEELNDIQDWRRRTHGRIGNSRPLPLHK